MPCGRTYKPYKPYKPHRPNKKNLNPLKLYILLLSMLLVACNPPSTPRPRGYFRIDLPEAQYVSLQDPAYKQITGNLPYTFQVNSQTKITPHEDGEKYWIDILYPQLNACVHCSYKPVQGNLRELSDDAQKFVYNHAGKANAIPEQGFENSDEKVYGVMFELIGNTASPCQFYLTDSLHHFFRGAVYFNCVPNQDSLAPVRDYIVDDMRYLVETMQWR